jgi:N-acetylmuramoyl-L-alanine amidase
MRSNIFCTVIPQRGDDKPDRLFRWLAVAVAIFGFTGCATGVKDTSRSFTTVVIDAGHGGHDDGARSRWGGREKNNTLAVALKLDSKLRAAGFRTVLTRRDDHFVELNDRAAISNRQNNAFFVSVHFNDSRRRKIHGAEVYYKAPVAQPVAQRILANVGSLPGGSRRYVKTANFRVLRLNRFPAVLVECGYLSNRSEGALCATEKHQERLASAIASAIIAQRGVPAAPNALAASATGGTAPVGTTQR